MSPLCSSKGVRTSPMRPTNRLLREAQGRRQATLVIIRRRTQPMSLRPIKRLLVVGSMLLLSIGPAPAQTPSSEAMSAARSLVTTLKLTEQYKALLPAILLSIKPALTQDRPEIESDFEAKKLKMAEAYAPFYNAMVDAIAAV